MSMLQFPMMFLDMLAIIIGIRDLMQRTSENRLRLGLLRYDNSF